MPILYYSSLVELSVILPDYSHSSVHLPKLNIIRKRNGCSMKLTQAEVTCIIKMAGIVKVMLHMRSWSDWTLQATLFRYRIHVFIFFFKCIHLNLFRLLNLSVSLHKSGFADNSKDSRLYCNWEGQGRRK